MRKSISALLLFAFLTGTLLTGCSREEMNTQIAESIGTLGMYENNEPVETPKMKAEKEIQAAKNAEEEDLTTHVDAAARLAASYDYAEALKELALIDEDHQDDERVISAKIEYQRLQNLMVAFKGSIPHFTVKCLIADKEQAFDGDDMSYYYNNWALTTEEFQAILQALYENQYILMDIEDVVIDIENEDGTVSFALNHPQVPEGKTPIVLSFEANYYSEFENQGFSEKMVLDESGEIQSEYLDSEGQTVTGAFDVVPIVNQFVEEHPDFSLRGAKGIVSVTGYQGVFGYGIETGGKTISAIAERLKEDGWKIACQGYGNNLMESELDNDSFVDEMEEWQEKVGSLVGETSLLVFPYGEEVSVGGYKQTWLLEEGYQYFFSIWATMDYLEVNSDYVRQSRRVLDGYDLHFYGDSMDQFFDASVVLDPMRPSFE